MKKIVLITTLLMAFVGCSDDSDVMTDNYYVKYVVDVSNMQKAPLDVSVKSKSNKDLKFEINDLNGYWEKVVGPVRKGFKASMEVSHPVGKQIIHSEIYVRKNDGPFELKMRDDKFEWRTTLEMDYTIDF